MNAKSLFVSVITANCWLACCGAQAEVVEAVSNGFQIKQRHEIPLAGDQAFRVFVDDFSQWWDVAHSYSGKAENLSLDVKQGCFLEKLPDGGFVRHLEIVYYHPGRTIRFTGGLGPLQQMGVCGALTINFSKHDGQTVVEVEYNVVGRDQQGLDRLATAVDQVLTGQLKSFRNLCDQKSKE